MDWFMFKIKCLLVNRYHKNHPIETSFTHTYNTQTHKFIIEFFWFLPVKGSATENKIRSICLKKRNIVLACKMNNKLCLCLNWKYPKIGNEWNIEYIFFRIYTVWLAYNIDISLWFYGEFFVILFSCRYSFRMETQIDVHLRRLFSFGWWSNCSILFILLNEFPKCVFIISKLDKQSRMRCFCSLSLSEPLHSNQTF